MMESIFDYGEAALIIKVAYSLLRQRQSQCQKLMKLNDELGTSIFVKAVDYIGKLSADFQQDAKKFLMAPKPFG